MAKDYYKTLGLERGATEEDIRRAHREMARKYHPDLNKDDQAAKEKFQEVQLAFDVLSDPEKRAKYDRFGAGFDSMGGGPGGPGGAPFDFDPSDLFGSGAGAAGPGGFADLFKQFTRGREAGGRGPSPPAPGADIEHEITIPFGTAVTGGEAVINVRRANGAMETITVKVPAGIEDGKKIRLRGQGDPSSGGGPDGDLLLTVKAAPHPSFTRRGTRLDLKAPVTLAEAARGGKIDVPTPRGTVTLSIPPGTSSGKRLRVKGHGVEPAGKPAGDLFVEVQIVLPESLSEEQGEQLAQIVGDEPQDPRGELRW